jgi:hypothetical protein
VRVAVSIGEQLILNAQGARLQVMRVAMSPTWVCFPAGRKC